MLAAQRRAELGDLAWSGEKIHMLKLRQARGVCTSHETCIELALNMGQRGEGGWGGDLLKSDRLCLLHL